MLLVRASMSYWTLDVGDSVGLVTGAVEGVGQVPHETGQFA